MNFVEEAQGRRMCPFYGTVRMLHLIKQKIWGDTVKTYHFKEAKPLLKWIEAHKGKYAAIH